MTSSTTARRRFAIVRIPTGRTLTARDVVLCGDRREAASVDPDTSVTASDLGRVGSKFGTYSRFDHAKRRLDFNRDGNITAADLGQVASAFGSCP